MSYKVEILWKDGSVTHTEYAVYTRASNHAHWRLDEPDCEAVRVTNEMTGKLRFKLARGAAGLKWLGPA